MIACSFDKNIFLLLPNTHSAKSAADSLTKQRTAIKLKGSYPHFFACKYKGAFFLCRAIIVRTRFAPSPTGYMHVGNLRTALYTYLMAKHEDGTFILRIEDTDQGRYVEGAVDVIYNTLRETGLLWDEGPDIGGPVGPYVQSERMGMFKQYAEQLVAEGKAYYCFCTEERLEALHAEQRANGEMTHYDGCCRDLPKEEVQAAPGRR